MFDKLCTRLKKNHKFHKATKMGSGELHATRQDVQDTVEDKRCAMECESVVEQYQDICVGFCG